MDKLENFDTSLVKYVGELREAGHIIVATIEVWYCERKDELGLVYYMRRKWKGADYFGKRSAWFVTKDGPQMQAYEEPGLFEYKLKEAGWVLIGHFGGM